VRNVPSLAGAGRGAPLRHGQGPLHGASVRQADAKRGSLHLPGRCALRGSPPGHHPRFGPEQREMAQRFLTERPIRRQRGHHRRRGQRAASAAGSDHGLSAQRGLRGRHRHHRGQPGREGLEPSRDDQERQTRTGLIRGITCRAVRRTGQHRSIRQDSGKEVTGGRTNPPRRDRDREAAGTELFPA